MAKKMLIDIIYKKTGQVVETKKLPDTPKAYRQWSFYWSMQGDKNNYYWKLRKVI
jgi:hypothetical protein